MVQIQNSDAITAIRDGARLSISEGFPQDLGKTVVPVMDMTPRFHRISFCKSLARTTTAGAAGAVWTTSTDADTYITGITLGIAKDAANDAATGVLETKSTVGGVSTVFVRIPLLTLTAQSEIIHVHLKNPIKLDRGAIVYLGAHSFTAGIVSMAVAYFGYEVT